MARRPEGSTLEEVSCPSCIQRVAPSLTPMHAAFKNELRLFEMRSYWLKNRLTYKTGLQEICAILSNCMTYKTGLQKICAILSNCSSTGWPRHAPPV
jgi:hypothetical protein